MAMAMVVNGRDGSERIARASHPVPFRARAANPTDQAGKEHSSSSCLWGEVVRWNTRSRLDHHDRNSRLRPRHIHGTYTYTHTVTKVGSSADGWSSCLPVRSVIPQDLPITVADAVWDGTVHRAPCIGIRWGETMRVVHPPRESERSLWLVSGDISAWVYAVYSTPTIHRQYLSACRPG
jgi:hypothetical protein